MRFCAAKAEKMRILRRDRQFRVGDKGRFRPPSRRSYCSKLVMKGEVVSDQEALLVVSTQHFKGLAKSRADELPS